MMDIVKCLKFHHHTFLRTYNVNFRFNQSQWVTVVTQIQMFFFFLVYFWTFVNAPLTNQSVGFPNNWRNIFTFVVQPIKLAPPKRQYRISDIYFILKIKMYNCLNLDLIGSWSHVYRKSQRQSYLQKLMHFINND